MISGCQCSRGGINTTRTHHHISIYLQWLSCHVRHAYYILLPHLPRLITRIFSERSSGSVAVWVRGCMSDGRGMLLRFPLVALGPTQLIQWSPMSLSQRANRPAPESDHSPPSSAVVKN
jgi:hypothetical protein